MKLQPEFKIAWLAALRSGDYVQGRRYLVNGEAHCCLGVACKIIGAPYLGVFGRPRVTSHPDWNEKAIWQLDGTDLSLDLAEAQQDILANMNDIGRTFLEIADYIEENL